MSRTYVNQFNSELFITIFHIKNKNISLKSIAKKDTGVSRSLLLLNLGYLVFFLRIRHGNTFYCVKINKDYNDIRIY